VEDEVITVAEIMTTALHTLKATDTVYAARQLMTERHIRHVPIVDDAGRLVGLVSQRDVLAASRSRVTDRGDNERRQFETSVPLGQIMTTQLSVVSEKMNLREAALRLQAHKYGCLPVVAQGKLKGIITEADFVAVAINLLEQLELADPPDDTTLDE
jgi:CBS domain-containing membrane protein